MIKMKSEKLALAFSAVLLSGSMAMGQTPDDVVKAIFPETAGELAIVPGKTTYNKAYKARYRELYAQMNDGLEEIEKFKLGGADSELLTIFDLKTLKDMQKAGTIDELEGKIKSERHKIAELMKDQEKFGADSAFCVRQLSMFSEFIKQNNFKDAYNPWSVLIKDYPMCNANIYQHGRNIIVYQLQQCKTGTEQQPWIDTLMMVYDNRIKYFARTSKLYGEGYVLGRKGVDMAKYRPAMIDAYYETLNKSVELGKEKTEVAVIQTTMKATIDMYNAEKIDASQVVDQYLLLTDILQKQRTDLTARIEGGKEKDPAKTQKELDNCNTVITGVDQLFSNSTAAQCETLNKAFEPRFKQNPEDVELLRKIVNILDRKGCTDLKLYEDATIKLTAKEPSELACRSLGRMLDKKGRYDEAIENYKKAIGFATADSMKANYNYSIAVDLYKQKQYSSARTYCNKALEHKANYGQPYILIATMYAQTANSIGESAFDHQQVFWLVIDKLNRAKAVDPSVTSDVNKLIGGYRSQCPNKEEAFMHSVTNGASVTIGGWIGETTTARF
ncbi:MAG: hypothetical protein J6V76_00860 [Bacteroidales bacterium]|nr:hypothetical protein [Bacteroidales bacterium]